MKDAGMLIDSEFKITYEDPPIFGYGDVILDWKGEELLGEIKTAMSEGFEYRKKSRKAKAGHLIQILIYMKILKKARGILIYENKNNHELLAIPVEVNEYYIKWVDEAFEWMRTVRKAWEEKKLPSKNYRSNSKICKTCPLKATCDEAGKGLIKIKSLEPIDENQALSMV
jgi:CRISPR/Cas system-associated exonuclease Cas4 (RecB family)